MSANQAVRSVRALVLAGAVGVLASSAVAGGPPPGPALGAYFRGESFEPTTVSGPTSISSVGGGTNELGYFGGSFLLEYGTIHVTADVVRTVGGGSSRFGFYPMPGLDMGLSFSDVIHAVGPTTLVFRHELTGSAWASMTSGGCRVDASMGGEGQHLGVQVGGTPEQNYFETSTSTPQTITLNDGDTFFFTVNMYVFVGMTGTGEAHASFGSTAHLYIDVLQGGYTSESGTVYAPTPGAAAAMGMLAVFGARHRRR